MRLCDVPLNVRAAAARRIIRQEPEHAEDVLYAAAVPSSRTYWLPETHRVMVENLTRIAA